MRTPSEYVLGPVRKGPDFTFYRGRQNGSSARCWRLHSPRNIRRLRVFGASSTNRIVQWLSLKNIGFHLLLKHRFNTALDGFAAAQFCLGLLAIAFFRGGFPLKGASGCDHISTYRFSSALSKGLSEKAHRVDI
jgi:hypothetical protein